MNPEKLKIRKEIKEVNQENKKILAEGFKTFQKMRCPPHGCKKCFLNSNRALQQFCLSTSQVKAWKEIGVEIC